VADELPGIVLPASQVKALGLLTPKVEASMMKDLCKVLFGGGPNDVPIICLGAGAGAAVWIFVLHFTVLLPMTADLANSVLRLQGWTSWQC
jgi:hypothetical protein